MNDKTMAKLWSMSKIAFDSLARNMPTTFPRDLQMIFILSRATDINVGTTDVVHWDV